MIDVTCVTFKDDLQLVCKHLESTDTAPILWYDMLLVPVSTGKLKEVTARVCSAVHRSQQRRSCLIEDATSELHQLKCQSS